MENELIRIQNRAAEANRLPARLRDPKLVELRADYKKLHAKWMAAKAQTEMT